MPESATVLYLVVPCYNEESILRDSAARMVEELSLLRAEFQLSDDSRVLLIDDGSRDSTWNIIDELTRNSDWIAGLKLARNFGHQGALLAGLMKARELADCTISLDADLQDDITVLPQFMREYFAGNDVVYGVRNDRTSDSWFKRNTALGYYRLLEWLGGKIIYNHADFRLMSRRALNTLAEFEEANLFLRGIIPLVGFRQSIVYYKRLPASRPTHYPLAKMLLLALDGVTSFSVRPIRLITLLGFAMFSFSFAMLGYYALIKLFGETVRGWTSLIFVSLLLGGIQLFSIGIIGEYIGKIYTEVKHRPRFIEETFRKGGKKS